MRRALLIYNPFAGFRRQHRLRQVESAAAELRRAGVMAEIAESRGPAMAGDQAQDAIDAGFDTIIACGGDGTIHDVLQGMVGHPWAALGVLPLGTANALANDLKVPRDPVQAMRRQLQYVPSKIAAGVIESFPSNPKLRRYFTVMSGVGPDALLVYSLSAEAKERWGVSAYVAKAFWEYITYRDAPFELEITDIEGRRTTLTSAQVMAVRIQNFGGPLKRFARGARLTADHLRTVVFRGSVRFSYPAYLLAALFGIEANIPGVTLMDAQEIVCRALPGREHRRIYCEADGEYLWTVPVRIAIVPEAFSLLMPRE